MESPIWKYNEQLFQIFMLNKYINMLLINLMKLNIVRLSKLNLTKMNLTLWTFF